MRYANQQIRRRPSRANDANAVPYTLSHDGEAPRTDHLRPWGCVCYVHEESTRSFGAKARKAYLLGLSDNHADGVYEVLMADTLTVRHSMNVVFHQMPDVSPPDMPNELLFNLRPLAPIAVPDPDSPSVDVGDGRNHPDQDPPSESVVPVMTRKSRYPLNAVVTTGDLSRKGAVVQRRCVALNNKTIQQALQTTYIDNTGKL